MTLGAETGYDKTEVQPRVQDRGSKGGDGSGRDLDIAESVLRRWIRELSVAPAAAFPGSGHKQADQAEIAALKQAVIRLRAAGDFLTGPCARSIEPAASTFDAGPPQPQGIRGPHHASLTPRPSNRQQLKASRFLLVKDFVPGGLVRLGTIVAPDKNLW